MLKLVNEDGEAVFVVKDNSSRPEPVLKSWHCPKCLTSFTDEQVKETNGDGLLCPMCENHVEKEKKDV